MERAMNSVNYWKCYFHRSPRYDGYEMFLFHVSNGQSYKLKIVGNTLQMDPCDEGEKHTPLLVLYNVTSAKAILRALCDGLAEAGFIAEVDNAQRTSAQAVAEDRKEQIGWLRKQIENILPRNEEVSNGRSSNQSQG